MLTLEELRKADIKYLETGGERKLNILYKQTPEEDLYLDLYYPTGKRDAKCPVVIYTHGGGWAAGDKQGAAGPLFAPLFKKLLEKGFCVASVNYRLWNKKTSFVPECVADAKDAMRYLAKNSEALKVDPDRFFSMGDSAGGHLSQMLLLTSPESQPGDPALAGASYKMVAGVSWYGFTNVENDDLYFPERGLKEPKAGTTVRIIKLGATPEEARTILHEMSPTSYLTKDSPPLLVMQGDQDTAVSVKMLITSRRKLRLCMRRLR